MENHCSNAAIKRKGDSSSFHSNLSNINGVITVNVVNNGFLDVTAYIKRSINTIRRGRSTFLNVFNS